MTSVITSLMNRSQIKDKRKFDEKFKAYTGLLQSVHKAALEKSKEAAMDYALWEAHVQLVGSPEVIKYTKKFKNTAPGIMEHDKAFDLLIKSMRTDLGIDVRSFEK